MICLILPKSFHKAPDTLVATVLHRCVSWHPQSKSLCSSLIACHPPNRLTTCSHTACLCILSLFLPIMCFPPSQHVKLLVILLEPALMSLPFEASECSIPQSYHLFHVCRTSFMGVQPKGPAFDLMHFKGLKNLHIFICTGL